MVTRPKRFAVRPCALRGLTGTSPSPATLATSIVPAGAIFAFRIDTGPPTSPIVPRASNKLPLTVIAGGFASRKPNAAGGAAVSVLALGCVA